MMKEQHAIVEKIHLCENKTLKIANALIREKSTSEERDDKRFLYMMDAYIKTKGLQMKGPIITYSSGIKGIENGTPVICSQFMVQLSEPLDDCVNPYLFKSEIRTGPCVFVRFTGNPINLNYAFAKIGVYAFENDIDLDGSSYTVFVNQDEENAVIDIFMPKRKEDVSNEAVLSE